MLHTIRSDELTVELTDPGCPPNDNFRFDRTSYISEVILRDGTRFGASEPRNLSHPSSRGRGFCSCIRWDISDQVAVGDYYPLLGIGLVKKPDEGKYVMFRRYEEGFVPFEIKSEYGEDTAAFEVLPMPCQGYAFLEKRTIRVIGNRVENRVILQNVGEKPAALLEYCHNFLSIEGMAVGPDYSIEFPLVPDLSGLPFEDAERGGETNFEGFGSGFRMKRYEPASSSVALDGVDYHVDGPFRWRVVNTAADAWVAGVDDIRLSRVKIWSCDHMVCPEIYQRFTIRPGETVEWSRDLEFGRL